MSGDIRLKREFIGTALLLLLFAFVPLVTRDVYWLGVLVVSAYFAILASSWNLLAGFTGQFSLAPAAFAMIGAYGAALSSAYYNVPPIIGLVIGTAFSGLIGLILGRIVMRLRGPYLALTTLSFAEIARLVASNSINITRGDLGLPLEAWFNDRVLWFYVFLGALALVVCGLYLLLRSQAGLFLEAIRDDEIAAARSGVRIVFWKTAAFAISSAAAGFAGALYAYFASLVTPELGLVQQTGLVVSMTVIGGMGSLIGPVVGAFLVYVTSEWLRDIGGWQLVVFAALVIVFARLFRTGLWGLVVAALVPRRKLA